MAQNPMAWSCRHEAAVLCSNPKRSTVGRHQLRVAGWCSAIAGATSRSTRVHNWCATPAIRPGNVPQPRRSEVFNRQGPPLSPKPSAARPINSAQQARTPGHRVCTVTAATVASLPPRAPRSTRSPRQRAIRDRGAQSCAAISPLAKPRIDGPTTRHRAPDRDHSACCSRSTVVRCSPSARRSLSSPPPLGPDRDAQSSTRWPGEFRLTVPAPLQPAAVPTGETRPRLHAEAAREFARPPCLSRAHLLVCEQADFPY